MKVRSSKIRHFLPPIRAEPEENANRLTAQNKIKKKTKKGKLNIWKMS